MTAATLVPPPLSVSRSDSDADAEEGVTPEDLLRMPEGEVFELVDGELLEKQVSMSSSEAEGTIYFPFMDHLRRHPGARA